MYLTIITYILSPDDLSYGVYIPISLFLCQRLMIALKYATMTDEEYERILPRHKLTTEEFHITMEYNVQSQIISGLLGNNRELVEYQVANAAAELGIDISSANFLIPKQLITGNEVFSDVRVWEYFIKDAVEEIYKTKSNFDFDKESGYYKGTNFDIDTDFLNIHHEIHYNSENMNDDENNYIKVPVGLVALSLIGRAAKTYVKIAMYGKNIGLIFCFLIALQPFIILIDQPVQINAINIIYFISSTFVTVFFSQVTLLFLAGCFYDALRKRAVATKLNEMLELDSVCFYGSLQRIKLLYDRDQGNVDFIFKDGFQNKKNELQIKRLFENIKINRKKSMSGGDTDEIRQVDIARDTVMTKADIMETFHLTDTKQIKPPTPVMEMNPHNALAFLALRQLLKVYGRRFGVRFDIFLGILSQIVLLLMLVVVILLIESYDSSAIINSALYRQVLIIVALFSISIILVVLVGGDANEKYNIHRYLFYLI